MHIKIGPRTIGDGCPVFIVAEISANHGRRFERASRLIREAKKRGADAVKFQVYTPDTLTIDSNGRHFTIRHPKWGGQTLYDLYKKAFMPWRWLKRLKRIADDEAIVFFATAFDRTAVDCLEELGVSLHKISSFELVDIPLIEYVASKKKPLMISTGMATVREIQDAVRAAKGAGARDICLLKCVSSYPALPEEMNLRTIPDMRKRFGVPVGLSDHTEGTAVAAAAVALGAAVIEKHFTLSRAYKTADNFFSIEPEELSLLVDTVRRTEKALGSARYGPAGDEEKSRIFRRSLFVVHDVRKGEVFSPDNVRSIRPGSGLPPKYYKMILGRKAKRAIRRGTPLKQDMVR